MTRSETIRAGALLAVLVLPPLAACSAIPGSGPLAGQVAGQGQANGRVLFDVVPVDERVVATLRAEPQPSLAARFKEYGKPPELKIAVGDTLRVLLWQSGEFSLLAPTAPVPIAPPRGPALPVPRFAPRYQPVLHAPALARPAVVKTGAAAIPDQVVQPDGTITIPYAGAIPAAGHTPEEVQQQIEARLANATLLPQALVIDKSSPANSVSASGEVLKGARVPLLRGGARLLEVIAAAGGAHAPVRTVFVRLSRGPVTATIPLQTLVSDPAENIYAAPGDVLTLIAVPPTFTVFGAAGHNAEIPFNADRPSLAEALAQSKGLKDSLANSTGVFLFRWERERVVRAFGLPLADGAADGLSPIAYRFDLGDGNSYLLAREFPMRDKDVIFIADAAAVQVGKVFQVIGNIVGPYRNAILLRAAVARAPIICRKIVCSR
jgi:polysaccharide export outer membrane protein